MSTILTNREKGAQFKERLALIKEDLESIKNWKTGFYESHPEFNTAKWGKHIENVMKGNIAPIEELIDALEAFVTCQINK